ncbi:MAG: DNA-methyltransferase [Acidimicrobiales bacterium]
MESELILGENLGVLRGLPSASMDLVYIDPPFGTGQTRRLDSIRTGRGQRSRTGFGGRTYSFEVVSGLSYADDMSLEGYLSFLYERLAEIHRVLRPTGSLYLHLDHRSVHHARFMLDEIFGEERFLNEIVWAYDYGGRSSKMWPRKHDNILWYAKSATWVFEPEQVEHIPYMAPGLVSAEKAARGKLPTDVWWMTIVPTSSRERTGYPTQKPLGLLERIVASSSRPGDLVGDFFAGTGTTGVAAQNLGRRFLMVDDNPDAIRIAEERTGCAPADSSSLDRQR